MTDALLIEHILNGWHLNASEVKREEQLNKIIAIIAHEIIFVCIHGIDQASNDTDIPEMRAFVFPAEASVVLRCMALGIDVREDRKDRAARMISVHFGELEGEPSSDQLREMLKKTAGELNMLPQHILLNEKLWKP
jgi:hypothetical protein